MSNLQLRKQRTKPVITEERPNVLVVNRSNQNFQAQIIDTINNKVLCTVNSNKLKGTKMEQAVAVGQDIAARAKSAKIDALVFNRNGLRYMGRVKAFADAVREGGITI